jgi:hypothetical protein
MLHNSDEDIEKEFTKIPLMDINSKAALRCHVYKTRKGQTVPM